MAISRSGLIWCEDERRRADLRPVGHPLNGLDYVEYFEDELAPIGQQYRLEAAFLKPPPAGLIGDVGAFAVEGGVRVVDVRVLDVIAHPSDPLRLVVFVDRSGDFSVYRLLVAHDLVDEELSEATFSFKAACPSEFDCLKQIICTGEDLKEPELDYLAKDYQSFRRLMVDLIAERNPDWRERLAADLGMALVELFAYAGDYLSYQQDAAVSTEAFLDTCLHRISARRHALLIDYRMHNGRNAAGFAHFRASAGTSGVVPQGAQLTTRIGVPLIGGVAAPGPVIASGTADFDADPALADTLVFETTARTQVDSDHNALRIHTWGNAECCLAKGANEAFLYRLNDDTDPRAFAPQLEVGAYLLLEEVASPVTGLAADRDPARRQVVRITDVEEVDDAAYSDVLTGGVLTPIANPGDPTLPLQRVRWREEDALAFTLCLSTETPETGRIDPVSLARGNMAPVDHGRTVVDNLSAPAPGRGRWPIAALKLPKAPVTFHAAPIDPDFSTDGRVIGGRHALFVEAWKTAPATLLDIAFENGEIERWEPVPHLLDSDAYNQHFVAEVDNAGEAILRFGDDQYGKRPLGVSSVAARYRVGGGRVGNIGSGALVHILEPDATLLTDPENPAAGPETLAAIEAVYQPLAMVLGQDPETIEEVREIAPEAFRAEQFRAVTEADWAVAALKAPGVAAAKARFRWTGSWHTVFVAAQPEDDANLTRLPGGAVVLEDSFAAEISGHLKRYKLAGYDLRVRAADYVPLEIDIEVCVARGHFRGEVLEEVARRLSNQTYAPGKDGFFHPLAFSFGEPVYLSRLIAAVEDVEGVSSTRVSLFKRYWEIGGDELKRGVIEMGDFEIALLSNDPSFPEQGVLRLTAVGGL
jgi:hypothetical protein